MSADRLVVFDMETGGLELRHPTIEIAAIAIDHDFREIETFEKAIRFDRAAADPAALAMNSFARRPERWDPEGDAEPAPVVFAGFCSFLRRHATNEKISPKSGKPYRVATLCGHNAASFDAPRLFAWGKTSGTFIPAGYHVVDTVQLAFATFFRTRGRRPGDLKLATLAEFFEIPTPDAHGALGDVRTTIAVLRALIDRLAPADPPDDVNQGDAVDDVPAVER